MNRKTEQSRRMYNQMASGYDASREGRYTRFHIQELWKLIDLKEGDAVLDVACGNGTLLGELSRKAAIQACGIDVSENMIHAAKLRYPDLHFETGACIPLPWREESFDVITVCCAFHHFEDPWGFVKECGRVLKRHGAVYIADPNFGAVTRFFANNLLFRFSKTGDVRVYSKKELERFFNHAGLRTVWSAAKGEGLFLKAEKQDLPAEERVGRGLSAFGRRNET